MAYDCKNIIFEVHSLLISLRLQIFIKALGRFLDTSNDFVRIKQIRLLIIKQNDSNKKRKEMAALSG